MNKTTVVVGDGELSVHHGPLPWWGNKSVETSEIVQLYTKENKSRQRRNNMTTGSFELHAVMTKGKHIKLLSALESSEYAFYAEQTIEDFLGIVDMPVRGEYGR